MKKAIVLICLSLILLPLVSCEPSHTDDGLTVVTTVFPAYDAVRALTDGVDGISASMLLKPGKEPHDYDPTPGDLIKIGECELFVYIGGESDEWVDSLVKSSGSEAVMLAMTDCVELVGEDEEIGGEHEHEHGGEEEYDEHVWTSPMNMIEITNRICQALCETDPDNKTHYESNRDKQTALLTALDGDFHALFDGAENTLVFGDRFPFKYFALEYGLDYCAAFPGCSSKTEPSGETVAYLIDKIRSDNVGTVFYIEFSTHKIADALAAETDCKTAMLHSAHNVTTDEFEAGETYVSLYRMNLETLRTAFSGS